MSEFNVADSLIQGLRRVSQGPV